MLSPGRGSAERPKTGQVCDLYGPCANGEHHDTVGPC